MTRLSEIATIESGAGFPIAEQGASGDEFPFLKVSDMNLSGNEIEIKRWNHSVSETVRHRLRAKSFPAGTVIFPKIGAAIGTNKKRLLTRPSCIDNNCMGVTGDPSRVAPWYLYYLFRAKDISDFASASNPPSIRKTEVEAWEVPVPSLAEQRRIVDLLSRAENILRMRREAEAKAKEIIPALFLHMFGDPARNERGWRSSRIGELCVVGTGGTPSRDVPEYFVGTIPWVKTTEVDGSIIRQTGEQISERALAETNCKVFPVETVVVAMYGQGQTRGRAAILGVAAATNQACAAILPCDSLDPLYVFAMLSLQYERLRAMGRGGNQANLNLGMIKSLEIPIPPMDLQRTFAARVTEIRSVADQSSRASTVSERVFESLLAGVFGET